MEIVRERLEREFDLDLLATAPNVAYQVDDRDAGEWRRGAQPRRDAGRRSSDVEEPYVKASVIVPKEYVGTVMELCNDRRGRFDHMEYLSEERVHLIYELPLAEIVLDFYDQLKTRTRGYASFDYDLAGFRAATLVRVDMLVGGRAGRRAVADRPPRQGVRRAGGRSWSGCAQEIPRQMFDVPIQAAIGSRVIARETIKAQAQGRLAKCYGGDISRKRKLLEKQKKGKKRMKQVGAVEVPQEAFLAVLNLGRRSEAQVSGRVAPPLRPPAVLRAPLRLLRLRDGRRRGASEHGAYVDALLARARARARRARRAARDDLPRRRHADVHRARALERLLAALPDAEEVTVEANPETVTPELAALLSRNRVNRVSIGAQSFQPPCWTCWSAAPAPTTSGAPFYRLRDAGFDNISLDLIYGIPGQSAADLERDLAEALRSSPSTSPATSSRRSRARASRTRTEPSSSARPRRWRATSSASSRR